MDFDNFFNKLTLINYPPGYLGSFIINLLACETDAYKKLSNMKIWTGLQSNQEWAIADYFLGGDRIKDHEQILDKLKLDFLDPNKALLYIIAVLTHKSFIKNNCLQPNFYKVFDDLYTKTTKELVDNKINDILFPYTKAHPYQQEAKVVDRSTFASTLPWKNKIYCSFPDDKKWIPAVLISHKHNKENLHQLIDSSYSHNNDLSDYKIINTYDIVFKQDLTTLYSIYPNFELTTKRKKLLDIATEVNNDILNKFDLNHTMCYNTSNVAKESIHDIYRNEN